MAALRTNLEVLGQRRADARSSLSATANAMVESDASETRAFALRRMREEIECLEIEERFRENLIELRRQRPAFWEFLGLETSEGSDGARTWASRLAATLRVTKRETSTRVDSDHRPYEYSRFDVLCPFGEGEDARCVELIWETSEFSPDEKAGDLLETLRTRMNPGSPLRDGESASASEEPTSQDASDALMASTELDEHNEPDEVEDEEDDLDEEEEEVEEEEEEEEPPHRHTITGVAVEEEAPPYLATTSVHTLQMRDSSLGESFTQVMQFGVTYCTLCTMSPEFFPNVVEEVREEFRSAGGRASGERGPDGLRRPLSESTRGVQRVASCELLAECDDCEHQVPVHFRVDWRALNRLRATLEPALDADRDPDAPLATGFMRAEWAFEEDELVSEEDARFAFVKGTALLAALFVMFEESPMNAAHLLFEKIIGHPLDRERRFDPEALRYTVRTSLGLD